MLNVRELILAALVGAVVSETVKLFFEHVKSKLKIVRPTPPFLIRLIIGVVFGILMWIALTPIFITSFWTFDNGTDNWTYTYNTLDASTGVNWDDDKKVLIAEFDFSQVAGNAGSVNRDPRATYSIDNLLPDWRHDWTGYETLKVDVRNTTGSPLEMTFSIFIDNCFYEFGGWNNLPSKAAYTTVVFNFTEPQYKTCISSDAFSNNPGSLDRVGRLDLVIGENVAPSQLSEVKGAIFIDNIRLQRSMWPLWLILGVFGVAFVAGLILYWLARQKPESTAGKRQKSKVKEEKEGRENKFEEGE